MTHRAFGISRARLCEQKKNGERTEELQAESRTRDDAEEHTCEVKVSELEKSDEPLVKSEDAAERRATRPETESQSTAEVTAADLRSAVEQKVEKTGKQGLLELLGAMKVDTTTKTKVKSFRKVTSGEESAVKRVVMESTSSMFQQASSSQR